jgi:hypothetical protein
MVACNHNYPDARLSTFMHCPSNFGSGRIFKTDDPCQDQVLF